MRHPISQQNHREKPLYLETEPRAGSEVMPTQEYLGLVFFAVISFVAIFSSILAPKLFSPSGLFPIINKKHRRSKEIYKYEPYECGELPIGEIVKFEVEYYLYPLFFLALDVLLVFLYLWSLLPIGYLPIIALSIAIYPLIELRKVEKWTK